MTYTTGALGGQPLSGHSQRIGNMGYTTLRVGGSTLTGTSQQLGAARYSTWSNRATSTTQRIGNMEYTTVTPCLARLPLPGATSFLRPWTP